MNERIPVWSGEESLRERGVTAEVARLREARPTREVERLLKLMEREIPFPAVRQRPVFAYGQIWR